MKNQYVGDVNDFKKYGILRSIVDATQWRISVAWMLTPDDGGRDGQKTDYLQRPSRFRGRDKALFDRLQRLVSNEDSRSTRGVAQSGIIPGAHFFEDTVPDDRQQRSRWLDRLVDASSGCDLVFLDPDNGLEVQSKRKGHKDSSKYVFWDELSTLWDAGSSLLVYQHFPRVKRERFMTCTIRRFEQELSGPAVTAFRTPNVAFFLATQPGKEREHLAVREQISERWHPLVREFRVMRVR